MLKIFKPAVESKKVAEISENGCKQKVAEKSEKQRLKSKKLLKNLKTVQKQKRCWNILKTVVESKKLLKNLKTNGWKQKVAKKSENVIHEKLYFICWKSGI